MILLHHIVFSLIFDSQLLSMSAIAWGPSVVVRDLISSIVGVETSLGTGAPGVTSSMARVTTTSDTISVSLASSIASAAFVAGRGIDSGGSVKSHLWHEHGSSDSGSH